MHRSQLTFLAVGLAAALMACKKKEAPAVIEEAPAAAAPVETDTSATLAEEPDLQQVGQKSAKPPKNGGSLKSSPAADAAGFSESGSFVVQVSVFKSSRQAANLVEKLAAQGYPAYVAEVESPTPELSGTYHRVRIGRFQRIADARAFGENTLRPSGFDFWVDNKKNDAVGGSGGSYSSEPSYSAPSASRPVEEYRPAEPAAPSEPAAPAGDAWGTPKDEPAAPAGDAWGTPKDMPGATPPATATPTPAAKPDTGKVNLDEW